MIELLELLILCSIPLYHFACVAIDIYRERISKSTTVHIICFTLTTELLILYMLLRWI